MIEHKGNEPAVSAHTGLTLLTGSAFLVLLAGVLLVPQIAGFDLFVSELLQLRRIPFLDTIMVALTLVGNAGSLVIIAVAIVLGLAFLSEWRAALVCATGFMSTMLLVMAIKVLVSRARPIVDLYAGTEAYSFPSGHMTNTTVIIGILVVLSARVLAGKTRLSVVASLLALIALVGISRVYLNAHWPLDVVAGACLGVCVVSIMARLTRHVRRDGKAPLVLFLVILSILVAWTVQILTALNPSIDLYMPRLPGPELLDDVLPETD